MMHAMLQLLVYVTVLIISVKGDACPKFGVDFRGNDIRNIPNTVSWEQCAEYCRQVLGCHAWTYCTPEFSRAWQRKYCYLKNSNYMQSYHKTAGLISGVTECGYRCPSEGINYEGNTIKSYIDVKSWEDCAAKCRSFSACHAWTWFNADNDAEKRSHHCYLKNSEFASGWKNVDKAVSGDRKCGTKEANRIDGGGWMLVRHVPAGNHWFKAKDNLVGTDVYGNSCGETCDQEWSIRFNNVNFNQFLFATGDETKWLIASRNAVLGEWYANKPKRILKSSTSSTSYHARWYRRSWKKKEPWISLNDHDKAVKEGKLLYEEESSDASLKHEGANVFVRFKDIPRACEHRGMRMDCPPHHVIHVKHALYGRTENGVCWHGRNLNCGDPAKSMKIVKEKCEGKLNCGFTANSRLFGDPCRGTFKYLEVDYTCMHTAQALQMGVPVDECAFCSEDAICERNEEKARCVCKCGFSGDGRTCTRTSYSQLLSSDGKQMLMEGSCALQRGASLGVIPRLSAGYKVKFDIFPTAFQYGWSNVLHMTTGENYGRYGYRTPGIWFHSQNPRSNANRFHICSAVERNHNYCYNTKNIAPKRKWTSVEVSQFRDAGHVFYTYRVKVNGKEIGTQMNKAAEAFNNVKIYIGDPWHNVQPGFIRNLTIVPDADAARPPGSIKDISNITKAMAGTWDVTYSNGHQGRFVIQPDGQMKVTWNNGRSKHDAKLMQTIDEENFPTDDGWVMALSIYRSGTWEYYQIREMEGVPYLQVEHFCVRHCRNRRGTLEKYCCYGIGTGDIRKMAAYEQAPKPPPIPNAVHWHDQGEVCFGAKGGSYGNFSITHSGKFKGIELVHVKGWVSCMVINPAANKLPTKWGCNHDMRRSLGTVVTNEHDSIIFPPRTYDSGMYGYDGMNAFSEKLAFSNWMNPLRVNKGQEFRIWFNEDLSDHAEGDNMGWTCAYVRAYIEK